MEEDVLEKIIEAERKAENIILKAKDDAQNIKKETELALAQKEKSLFASLETFKKEEEKRFFEEFQTRIKEEENLFLIKKEETLKLSKKNNEKTIRKILEIIEKSFIE